jgi:hypothetical protein
MAITILWSCLGCSGSGQFRDDGGGQFLDDDQGRADHQAATGHWPAPGRPLCPIMAVGT